jgi:hypothetical protein
MRGTDTVEIKLNNNDRIHFQWVKPGMLTVELHRPMDLRDGHGVVMVGCTYLEGTELSALLTALTPDNPESHAA